MICFPFAPYSSFHTDLTFLLLVSSHKSNGTIQTLSSLRRTQLFHSDFFFFFAKLSAKDERIIFMHLCINIFSRQYKMS